MILLAMKTKALYKYIKVVKKATENITLNFGMTVDDSYLVKLAVAEAVANIIEHSYDGETSDEIEYTINKNGNDWSFVLKDFGEKKKIENIKSRKLDDYKEGGLGVHIIKNIMDVAEYSHFENGTILTMKKKTGEN